MSFDADFADDADLRRFHFKPSRTLDFARFLIRVNLRNLCNQRQKNLRYSVKRTALLLYRTISLLNRRIGKQILCRVVMHDHTLIHDVRAV